MVLASFHCLGHFKNVCDDDDDDDDDEHSEDGMYCYLYKAYQYSVA